MANHVIPLFVCLALSSPVVLAGAVSPVTSQLTQVTVFPDRALVTRTASASLTRGDNALQLDGLPATLLPDSLRVTAEADGQVTIGSVESRRIQFAELAREREKQLVDEITALEDQLRVLDDQARAYTIQLSFIESIGKELPKNAGAELMRGEIKPDSWRQGWETLGNGANKLLDGMRRIGQDKRLREQVLAQKQRELAEIRSGQREAIAVDIRLHANTPAKVRLSVSYQVPDASWQSSYDARLDSDSGRIVLTQWGQVRQNTGEDWRDARLTLSTARPSETSQPPELQPWFIDFYRPRPAPMQKSLAMEADVAMAPAVAAPFQQAELASTEFSAEYRIAASVTVPADNATHRFAISEQPLESQLSLISVPRIAPVAYLQAKLRYAGQAPLPGGPVALFRDGVFIGNAELPLLRPAGEAQLAFGADDKIRIDYGLDGDTRASTGLLERQTRIERRYHIDISNHHGRPMEIRLQDQLPVARDERIKVEWLKGLDTPGTQDVDGRPGVAAWSVTLAPQEKRRLRIGYAVTYPRELSLPGFE